MPLTRDSLILRARQMADAVNATGDWPDDLVIALAETVLDNEWAQLLASAPWLRTSPRTVVLDAVGTASLAALDAGSGDTAERLFRVREVRDVATGREYTYIHPAQVAHGDPGLGAGVYGWTIDGGQLLVLGASPNASVSVRVSHRPPLLSDLAGGGSVVPFVAGGTALLAVETAALMLMRGAREGDEAAKLQMQGELLRQKLHDAQLRQHSGPIFVRAVDSADDWGST